MGKIGLDVWGKIPADLYTQEILLYLPARHLQILKSVCKDWLQLIKSAYFVRLHLSKANRIRIRVLVTFPSKIVDYYENTLLRIPFPPQFSDSTSTAIAGSADGLICLLHDGAYCMTTAIFNPSTGKCFSIKICEKVNYTPVHLYFCWFGNHPSVPGEYVLVLGTLTTTNNDTSPHMELGVYKFGTTYLKRIHSIFLGQAFYVRMLDYRGTLVRGVVHWPIEKLDARKPARYKIFAYHIGSNTHSEISAPTQREFRLGVGIAGGCLFATLKNYSEGVFEVWIMKKYSCWTKHANIHINGFHNITVLSPLGFFPNGDMVLDVNKFKLISYNFNHNEAMLLMKYECPRYEAIMCADSLVSPEIWEA